MAVHMYVGGNNGSLAVLQIIETDESNLPIIEEWYDHILDVTAYDPIPLQGVGARLARLPLSCRSLHSTGRQHHRHSFEFDLGSNRSDYQLINQRLGVVTLAAPGQFVTKSAPTN